MITSLENLKAYFANYCPIDADGVRQDQTGSNVDLGSFVYGDEDRVLDGLQAKCTFPILWMANISIPIKFNDGSELQKPRMSLVVFHDTQAHNFESEDTADMLCANIVLDIIGRMKSDKEEDLLDVDLDTLVMAPVSHRTNSNLFGWELTFEASLALDTCYNPLKWN